MLRNIKFYSELQENLEILKKNDHYREFKTPDSIQKNTISFNGLELINLSSNDYLGISSDIDIQTKFLNYLIANPEYIQMGSTSSRLLTGNSKIHDKLENKLAASFNRESALIFNSGYHMNIGLIPSIMQKNDLILSDKLNHATIIDGILLSKSEFIRYPHNDLNALEELLKKNRHKYKNTIIITESIFSMDGDITDLEKLVEIASRYEAVTYLDEAHGFGVEGKTGLGLAEATGLIDRIDIIGGTFGKSAASSGAFIVCDKTVRDTAINKARSVIFSTNIPPFQTAFNNFVIDIIKNKQNERQHLANISKILRKNIKNSGYKTKTASHIIPVVTGSNRSAVGLYKYLHNNGFYCLPIRHPTVPMNTARIRISLTALISENDINRLSELISNFQAS